jgi:hypothetical protein
VKKRSSEEQIIGFLREPPSPQAVYPLSEASDRACDGTAALC